MQAKGVPRTFEVPSWYPSRRLAVLLVPEQQSPSASVRFRKREACFLLLMSAEFAIIRHLTGPIHPEFRRLYGEGVMGVIL